MGCHTRFELVLPDSQSRVLTATLMTPLASDERIELPLRDLETPVLPLHQSEIKLIL